MSYFPYPTAPNPYQPNGGAGLGSLNQYDPNPRLTSAINRLAAAIEAMKPRVRVKMGRSE